MANVLISGELSSFIQREKDAQRSLNITLYAIAVVLGGECCFRVGLFACLNSCKLSYLRRKLSLFCKKCVFICLKKSDRIYTAYRTKHKEDFDFHLKPTKRSREYSTNCIVKQNRPFSKQQKKNPLITNISHNMVCLSKLIVFLLSSFAYKFVQYKFL
uniref:(northern house mosquito) hypothetical protein n=1 Tax=Culex pipiens TaxID=7175 RepID=A0A8D8LAA8_CULPI